MSLFGNGHNPSPGPDPLDEGPGPRDVVRALLAMAIQIGAPSYNIGDHRGCFEVYACTARLLLRSGKALGTPADALREALEKCALEVDVDQQAWIMRRAFDGILEAED